MMPDEIEVQIMGRPVRMHMRPGQPGLEEAIARLEKTFRDMDEAYELRWGSPPSALDTPTWLLMGALNLAHRVVELEQEASRHTQDLEKTLSKLLDDVPEDPSGGPLS